MIVLVSVLQTDKRRDRNSFLKKKKKLWRLYHTITIVPSKIPSIIISAKNHVKYIN